MHITDLGGHSGCRILLCENDDNRVFVRKISGYVEYNNRLRVQAEKQSIYKNETIKTPKVLNQGETEEGLFYFDMEYVRGITLSEYMKSIEVGKVRNLVQKLVREVITIDASEQEVNENIFLDKINSLKYNLLGQENPIIDKAIQILENHSWSKFKKTSCHGDLTLENIIVKDNELYLIDFLDSFYDCWILDISTLMQDVQTLWSYRYEEEININTLIRLVIFRDILMETVQSIAPDYHIEVYYALLLKLIRIFPYIKDVETMNFLNEKTKSIIEVIRLLEEQ